MNQAYGTTTPLLKFIRFAAKNLSRNKRRNLATGISILAGVVGLNLLGAYIHYAHVFLSGVSIYYQNIGHYSVFRKDALDNLPRSPLLFTLAPEDVERIHSILKLDSQFDFMGKYLNGQGLVLNAGEMHPFAAASVDFKAQEKIFSSRQAEDSISELLAKQRNNSYFQTLSKNSRAISLTNALRDKLMRPNLLADLQLLTKSFAGDLSAVDVQLVGLHSTGMAMSENTGLSASTELLQELFQTDRFTSLSVFLKEGASISKSIEHLKSGLGVEAAQNFDLLPYKDERVGHFYVGSMGFLYSMATFFLLLVFMVIAITVFNTSTLAIFERRQEIGTLKALGWPNRVILKLFLIENFLLMTFSVALATLLAHILMAMINAANIRFEPIGISGDMPFRLLPSNLVSALAGLSIASFGILICLFAVRGKVHEKPIDLLQGGAK